ncbi:hypothetical protein JBW_01705 [Pelosinus fermentans JBW45]|uniref:Uncharacterized protein n=1 Tax=Pelosinus fermentans JBW45 TaxID=1192197 RepID=I8TYA7_9FIRM|nr:hypothetical protein JBW_01705 [Pelosinus fermentans JBW45]
MPRYGIRVRMTARSSYLEEARWYHESMLFRPFRMKELFIIFSAFSVPLRLKERLNIF